ILTSNLGASAFAGESQRPMGFAQRVDVERADAAGTGDSLQASRALEQARTAFPPELWGRLDEKLVFAPLARGEVARIAQLLLAGVRVLASWHRRSGLEPPPLRDVDVVLLAVSDQAVSEVCGRLEIGPGQLVAHLAGALGLSPLSSARRKGARTGSLHPLRPFRGADGDVLEGFAAGISGSDPSAAADLAQLAV